MPFISSIRMSLTLSMVCVALALGGCGGSNASSRGGESTAANTPQSQPTNTQGRLLASNCFQCHGTGGVGGFDYIRGKEAHEIREYLGRAANSSIMAAHAQGYTPAQIDAIVAYLQQ